MRKYKAINFASFSAAATLFGEIERVLEAEYDEATLEERERERIEREEEDFVLNFAYDIDPERKTMTVTEFLGGSLYKGESNYIKYLYKDKYGKPDIHGDTEITVPSQVGGYTVTEIGDACFFSKSLLSYLSA